MSPTATVAGRADERGDDADRILGLVPRQQREHLGLLDDTRCLQPRHDQRGVAIPGHDQHGQAFERHRLVAGEVRQVATDRDQQDIDAGLVHALASPVDAIEMGRSRR